MDNLSRQVKQLEAIIKNDEDAARKQVEHLWSSTQLSIDDARKTAQHLEAVIYQMEAARKARKQIILSDAFRMLAPVRHQLGDAKHHLAAISAPILRLPTECIMEIMTYFNVDTSTVVLLLVSKRWHAIAKATPQLWSKIALTYGPGSRRLLRHKEAHICGSLKHLSFVLDFARNAPLDIELNVRSLNGGPITQHVNTSGDPSGDFAWLDRALTSLGAEGRSRRWRALYITSWCKWDKTPFEAISGPFESLRILSISPSYWTQRPYEPLIAAIVQGAPRLSIVDTHDSLIIQQVHGWRDRIIWGNIKSYRSLICCDDLSFLSEASDMTDLSLSSCETIPQGEPVSLPSLRTLHMFDSPIQLLQGFRLPILETLLLNYADSTFGVNPGTIALPTVTSMTLTDCPDVRILQCFVAPTLHHLHIAGMNYTGQSSRSKEWQAYFLDTFNGSQFMPRPISLHLEVPISDSQILSVLFLLPQIEELRMALGHSLGPRFWSLLTPRGVGGRRKDKQYCPKLRIMVVQMASQIYKDRALELGVKMATARAQEGHPLTHLLFSWWDKSTTEVLGSFSTLPPHLARTY